MCQADLKYWYLLSQTCVIYANKLLHNPLNGQWTENQEVCVSLFAADSWEMLYRIFIPIQGSQPPHHFQDQLVTSPEINLDEKVFLCES